MFEATYDGVVYTLSALPVIGLAVAATLAWLAPLLLWGFALRSEARGCLPALGAGVLGLFASVFLGMGGTLAVIFASLSDDGCGPLIACTPALERFGGLELATIGGILLLSFLWALCFAAIGYGRPHPAALVGALGWLALCSLGAAPPVFQLGTLAHLGPLPRIALDGPPFVHAGNGVQLQLRVLHPHPERVELPATVEVPAQGPGTFATRVQGTAGPLAFSTRVELPVREERGHPQFPLRSGNTWTYAPFESAGASSRVLFSGGRRSHHTDHSRTLTLKVGDPVVERGVRWFPVRITTPESNEVVRVAAVDGELQLPDGRPFVSGKVDPQGSFGGSSGCSLAPLQGFGNCRCPDRVGGIVDTPPGPSSCSKSRGGGLLEGLVRGVTMIATVGIVDPGSSWRSNGIQLVSFEPGPDSAPAAEPQWVYTPIPKVIAARQALDGATFESDKVKALTKAMAGATDLSCDAAEVVLLGEPFFHQDDLLVVLAPHMTDPLACDRLIGGIQAMSSSSNDLRARIRDAR